MKLEERSAVYMLWIYILNCYNTYILDAREAHFLTKIYKSIVLYGLSSIVL